MHENTQCTLKNARKYTMHIWFNTQCTLKNARKYTMHIWFNTHDYGIFGPIVFLERQKYTGKPTFGKVLIKKAWRARTQKKILKQEALNVLYFQRTNCTICTCNVHKKYWPYCTATHYNIYCTAMHYNISYELQQTHNTRTIKIQTQTHRLQRFYVTTIVHLYAYNTAQLCTTIYRTYCNTRTTHARSKYRPKRIVYNDFISRFSIHHSTFVRLQYCTATHYNISYVLQHTHNTRTIEIHT